MHLDLIFAIEELTDARIALAMCKHTNRNTADAERLVHNARRKLLKLIRAMGDQTA